jgi:hypothetical protein
MSHPVRKRAAIIFVRWQKRLYNKYEQIRISSPEPEEHMSDLEAFELQVKEKIKQLSHKDARKRREAAAWLGEAGDPDAITKLRQVYKEDTDKRVREAAKYSLGMFRALEKVWNTDKRDQALERLEAIALEGKMGKRVPVPTRIIVLLEVLLFISLLVLLGINFYPQISQFLPTPAPPGTQVASSVGSKDRATLVQEVRTLATSITNDAATLQAQYQSVAGGGALSCQAFFNNPAPMQIASSDSQAFPDIARVVEQLNTAQADLVSAKARFDEACSGGAAITGGEIGALLGPLVQLASRMGEINNGLAGLSATPTPEATQEPTATLEAAVEVTGEATAESTEAVAGNPRSNIGPLFALIDELTGQRGAHTTLDQAWRDAIGGSTEACRLTPPTIPEDYVLAPEDAAAEPVLSQSVGQVNLGLQLVRQGWVQFANSCAAGSLQVDADNGLQVTAAARTAFDNAAALLQTLR